jgi:hypothetical protein
MRQNKSKSTGLTILGDAEAIQPLPRVFMTLSAFQKMKCFVDLCDLEISGLGTVKRSENNFIIDDVFIIKQVTDSNGIHVKLDDKALNLFIYEMAKDDKDTSEISFQWHSHVYMPVDPSPEDKGTIKKYLNDFMISLVVNKYGEFVCRLDLFKPFYLSLNVNLQLIVPALNKDLVGRCVKDIEEMVRVKGDLIPCMKFRAKADPNKLIDMVCDTGEVVEKIGGR